MPSNLNSTHVMDEKGNCSLLNIFWNAPSNITQCKLSHYVIEVERKNARIVTYNESGADGNLLNMVSYKVCDCDSDNVSIRAVSVCNRTSESKVASITTATPTRLLVSPCKSANDESKSY